MRSPLTNRLLVGLMAGWFTAAARAKCQAPATDYGPLTVASSATQQIDFASIRATVWYDPRAWTMQGGSETFRGTYRLSQVTIEGKVDTLSTTDGMVGVEVGLYLNFAVDSSTQIFRGARLVNGLRVNELHVLAWKRGHKESIIWLYTGQPGGSLIATCRSATVIEPPAIRRACDSAFQGISWPAAVSAIAELARWTPINLRVNGATLRYDSTAWKLLETSDAYLEMQHRTLNVGFIVAAGKDAATSGQLYADLKRKMSSQPGVVSLYEGSREVNGTTFRVVHSNFVQDTVSGSAMSLVHGRSSGSLSAVCMGVRLSISQIKGVCDTTLRGLSWP